MTILQYTHILNHYAVYLKLMLYVHYVSIKKKISTLKKRRGSGNAHKEKWQCRATWRLVQKAESIYAHKNASQKVEVHRHFQQLLSVSSLSFLHFMVDQILYAGGSVLQNDNLTAQFLSNSHLCTALFCSCQRVDTGSNLWCRASVSILISLIRWLRFRQG